MHACVVVGAAACTHHVGASSASGFAPGCCSVQERYTLGQRAGVEVQPVGEWRRSVMTCHASLVSMHFYHRQPSLSLTDGLVSRPQAGAGAVHARGVHPSAGHPRSFIHSSIHSFVHALPAPCRTDLAECVYLRPPEQLAEACQADSDCVAFVVKPGAIERRAGQCACMPFLARPCV